jgi:hypothetical protein
MNGKNSINRLIAINIKPIDSKIQLTLKRVTFIRLITTMVATI